MPLDFLFLFPQEMKTTRILEILFLEGMAFLYEASGSEQHTKWTVMNVVGCHPDPLRQSFPSCQRCCQPRVQILVPPCKLA